MFHSHQVSLHHKFTEKLSAFILSYISDFCYSVYLVMSFGSNSSQVRVIFSHKNTSRISVILHTILHTFLRTFFFDSINMAAKMSNKSTFLLIFKVNSVYFNAVRIPIALS